MAMISREQIPKNASFNSVADAILINESDGSFVKEATQEIASSLSRQVRFGSIERREYNRMVGDHPDVRVGPPVTFSWEYGELPPMPIDAYESEKAERGSKGARKMSSITRKNMLRNVFEVSEEEILAAEKEVQKIRKQREQSSKQSETSAVVESSLRRAGRKMRKTLGKALFAMAAVPASPYSVSSVQAY
jgi:hypothetical protein